METCALSSLINGLNPIFVTLNMHLSGWKGFNSERNILIFTKDAQNDAAQNRVLRGKVGMYLLDLVEVGSYRRCSIKKSVLTNFTKFTRKHALAQVFSCEFCEICEITFFTKYLCATASDVDWFITRGFS